MPTPTATPSPFSLEAYPVVAQAKSGPARYTVTVVNKGSKPLHVNASTMNLHGQCSKLQFSPSHFTLAPGHGQHVTVQAPAATADYLAEFQGSLGQHGIGVGAAVGTRFVVGHPGTAGVHCTTASKPLAPSHQAGFPLWAMAAIAAAVLLLAVVVARKIRKGRAS